MPEEVPALTGRTRLLAAVGVVLAVAIGLLLRFWTRSGLWLDEALTVDIARLPLHDIPEALKHDGAPPLYYYLLHFWIALFGQSNYAVRSLSGVIAVVTLPVGWLCGRRFGGRAVAWTTLVLLASAPFASYYGTEARMYALIILLTGCGFLALQRALEAPKPGNLIAVAVVAAALLYTQYWSLYLVGMVGLWLIVSVVRDCRRGRRQDGALARADRAGRGRRALPALGAHLLVPVGAHLDAVGGAAKLLGRDQRRDRLHRQPGLHAQHGDQPGPTAGGHLLRHAGLGAVRRRQERPHHRARPAHPPRARGTTFVVVGTLFAAIAGGILTGSAFSSRYAAVVFLPLLLLIALGTTTLLNPKVRAVVVAIAVVAGLVSSAQNVTTQRTQANQVAAAINAQAKPGDVIAFCPDQLGPSVYRQVQNTGRYDMVTFPRRTGPAIVDWVDYAQAVSRASPAAFADAMLQRASAGAGHRIWLVWQPMYQTYGIKCETIAADSEHAGHQGRWRCPQHRGEPPGALLRADESHRVRRAGAGLGMTAVAGSAAAAAVDGTAAPGTRNGALGFVSHQWRRLPESLREAIPPYVVARIVVLGVLGLAHFVVDRTHPDAATAARVHAGLLGWDAGWYETIARQGYGPLGAQSLRFFPLVPLLTHGLAEVPGLGDGPALVLLANAAALAATAMLYVLVRREAGPPAVARRAVWILSLLPAAFVLVMGYAEAVLLVFAVGCFLALRPPPPRAVPASPWRRRWPSRPP